MRASMNSEIAFRSDSRARYDISASKRNGFSSFDENA